MSAVVPCLPDHGTEYLEYGAEYDLRTCEGVILGGRILYGVTIFADGTKVYHHEVPKGAPQTKPKRRKKRQ